MNKYVLITLHSFCSAVFLIGTVAVFVYKIYFMCPSM